LQDDLIPYIEAKFSTQTNAASRAIAGVSMGGGQSLNIGMRHLDTFGWIGAFSAAPNTRPPAKLVPSSDQDLARLKWLWISCGDEDRLINISQRVYGYFKEKNIPHTWHVDSGGHDWPVWKNDLYHFAQGIFR